MPLAAMAMKGSGFTSCRRTYAMRQHVIANRQCTSAVVVYVQPVCEPSHAVGSHGDEGQRFRLLQAPHSAYGSMSSS
jgi:hypothetical protein